MIGTLLKERYRIDSKLGEGGMGEVYLSEDTRLGRKVALKLLRADLTKDEDRVRRFEQEARAASALNHPNILTIHEIGQSEVGHFIVTEFVDGSTLRVLLTTNKLELKQLCEIGAQVADALAVAHRAGIIHRDIKPENIMVRRDGYVKLLDFGLAKLSEAVSGEEAAAAAPSRPMTTPGMVVGTVHYLSPEQAVGRNVDHRTDLFSLGCVLYETATGEPAFMGESFLEVLHKITSEQPRSMQEATKSVPPELQRIVEKCLAKDPNERYQHADEVAVDLRRLLRSSELVTGAGEKAAARPYKRGKAIDSLAVLPLTNASADPDAEYLSDGITESLINSLSQLPKLRVIARTTAFRYKGREPDPQTVGRDLKVGAVLTGRVVQHGGALVIQADLVDAVDGSQLWGERYNRRLADIFGVQEDIVREISEKLRLRLTGEEKKRMTKRHTENSQAYQAYLKGRFYWNKRTEEGLKKGIEYFQQAIEIDPGYALAYTGLADSYAVLGYYNYLPSKEAYPRAKAAAAKALAIDDTLAEAHASLANTRYYDWSWVQAERELKRAIELNPNYATAHHWYGLYLTEMGKFDRAIAELQRAYELDPLSLIIGTAMGGAFYHARQYDQAIEQLQKTLELDPNFGVAHVISAQAYTQKGMYEEAITALKSALTFTGGSREILARLGHTYAKSGRRDKAMEILGQLHDLAKQRHVPSYDVAIVHVGLGDLDQAFALLEKAYAERASRLIYINVDPIFDTLRSDPRFKDLLSRLGLPPERLSGERLK